MSFEGQILKEMYNHDGNIQTTTKNISGIVVFMLGRSSKMVYGGGRALVLHAQGSELSDSWHRSAFDSWIHSIKLY